MGKGFAVKTGVLASKNPWILTCDGFSVLPDQLNTWFKHNLIKKVTQHITVQEFIKTQKLKHFF